MNESSARAERFDRDAPPVPAYSWVVPQKPVAVRIPWELMEKLEREAVESYRSLTSRGSEIGGVLFGSIVPGNPALVEVQAYDAIPCDYATGPLYRLTGPELARLDRAIEQRRGAGLEPVGFFRSHTRKGVCLDPSDLELLDSRFGGPHQIALVVRPSAAKPSLGGIFIREDGAVRAEASYLEFPFSGPRETAPKPSAAPQKEVAGPRTMPAAPALPSARPVVRAQIVPIATRREMMPMAPPVAAAAPEPEPSFSAPEAEAAGPAAPPEFTPVAAAERLGENAPAGLFQDAFAAAAETAPAELSEDAPAARTQTMDTAPAPAANAALDEENDVEPLPRIPVAAAPRHSRRWLWFSAGTLAPALAVVGFLLSSGTLGWRRPVVPVPAHETGLSLRVERNAGDILLTWNRDGETIQRARRAVLSISDGAQQENVEMDLSQLRTGSIVYAPVASDVTFHMEVTVDGKAQPVSETLRVLRTRPSPMSDAPAGAPGPALAGARPAPAPAAAEQPKAEGGNPPEEGRVRPAPPARTFRPEPLAQRLRPAPPADLPDAPLVAAAPSGAPDLNLGGFVTIPAPPPPRAAAEPKAAPAAKAPVVGGEVRPAELIHRVAPQYPSLARKANAGGRVELMATIGVDGRVKDVSVITGNPMLRQAAIEAVKQWIYQPTLLDGKPVTSQAHVTLDFRPAQ